MNLLISSKPVREQVSVELRHMSISDHQAAISYHLDKPCRIGEFHHFLLQNLDYVCQPAAVVV
jgi:hypothetical protein